MIKKLSYRFLILFLIISMCVNTYTYTKSEASSAGISTAIQYFVDFAVSYLGYTANKQDRVSIANQLIKTYSAEKDRLYDFSKKLIFASWTKTLNFLGNKLGDFENDMKRYLTFVKSLLFNKDEYITSNSVSGTRSNYFNINNVSKKVDYSYKITGKFISIPFYQFSRSNLRGHYISIKDIKTDHYDSDINKIIDYPISFMLLGDNKCKIIYNGRQCFYVRDDHFSEIFVGGSVNLYESIINFKIDNISYSVTEFLEYNGGTTIYKEAFQDYLNYFFRNSIVKADKRSLSNTLNSAAAVKTIVKDIDLSSQDYNIIVDKVLEKLPELDNYVTDTNNSQVLNYGSDGVINREIDDKKTLTGSDIVNLNVDKLLENTANIADDVKQNSSLLKQVYDVVSNSRESILKLATDIALTNTTAINLARDLADIKAKTDVITSDTYADTLSDKISTSVTKSIGNTISSTLDNKLGNKDNKRINLDPLKNLIIKEKFPFSLPFDLKDTLTLMKSKQIIANFDLNIRGYHMKIDFSMFDSLVKKARPFFLLMFCVFLVLVSKKVLS